MKRELELKARGLYEISNVLLHCGNEPLSIAVSVEADKIAASINEDYDSLLGTASNFLDPNGTLTPGKYPLQILMNFLSGIETPEDGPFSL